MRAALWLLALFGIAVAVALFAGNNQGSVTLFWPPYRIDLSLNLVLLLLVAAFFLVHAAMRALAALLELPRQALRWRTQQKERAMHGALVGCARHLGDAVGNVVDGVKARHFLFLQEEDGVAFTLGEERHQHIRARHFLAARRLHVNGRTLQHPLEAGGRLCFFRLILRFLCGAQEGEEDDVADGT